MYEQTKVSSEADIISLSDEIIMLTVETFQKPVEKLIVIFVTDRSMASARIT